jgi:hypothetical protein
VSSDLYQCGYNENDNWVGYNCDDPDIVSVVSDDVWT